MHLKDKKQDQPSSNEQLLSQTECYKNISH